MGITRREFLQAVPGGIAALLLNTTLDSPRPPLEFRFSTFEDYNPPATEGTKKIENQYIENLVRNSMERTKWYHVEGDLAEKKEVFENPEKFKEEVLNQASEMGYSSADIKSLSVKKSAELACRLTASRLDYGGILQYERVLSKVENIQEQIETLESQLKEPLSKKENELVQARLIGNKRVLERAKESLGLAESAIGIGGGLEYDAWPVDRIYLKKPEVVCKHYSRVATAIFENVLKDINPSLMNMYMSNYDNLDFVDLRHQWNQVATVIQRGKQSVLHITFVDPTFLDSTGRINAYDERHCGKEFEGLKKQVAEVFKNLKIYNR